jgi:hypothetical protein
MSRRVRGDLLFLSILRIREARRQMRRRHIVSCEHFCKKLCTLLGIREISHDFATDTRRIGLARWIKHDMPTQHLRLSASFAIVKKEMAVIGKRPLLSAASAAPIIVLVALAFAVAYCGSSNQLPTCGSSTAIETLKKVLTERNSLAHSISPPLT